MRAARGFFLAGAILLVLTGAGHALAIATRPTPEGEQAEIVARMAALEGEMMGMTPSLLDAFLTLDAYFPILAILAGVQALMVWRMREVSAGRLRSFAAVSALGALVAAAVALAHELPPPGTLFALVAVCFATSAALARAAAPARAHER